MDSCKVTDTTEVVDVEDVSVVEEGVMSVQITPITLGMVLISEIFIGISVVSIGILFRETVNHILTVNTAMKSLVAEAVTKVHAGDMVVAEYIRSQKLKLIGQTSSVEGMVAKDVEHKMLQALE